MNRLVYRGLLQASLVLCSSFLFSLLRRLVCGRRNTFYLLNYFSPIDLFQYSIQRLNFPCLVNVIILFRACQSGSGRLHKQTHPLWYMMTETYTTTNKT